MKIYEDDFTGIKIFYTNKILIITKDEEIVCRKLITERTEVEDFVIDYLATDNSLYSTSKLAIEVTG